MALITAAEARAYLPGNSGTVDDTLLATLISRAEQQLAAHCGFPPLAGAAPTLEQRSLVFYLDGPDILDVRTVLLPIRPVVSITSIYDDPNNGYGSSYEVASSEWALDKATGRIRLLTSSTHAWSRAPEAIKVAGVFGLTTGSIDEFVKDAIGTFVAHKFQLRHTQGRQTATTQGRTDSYRDEVIPPHVRQIIAPLRMPEAGMSGAPYYRVDAP